MEIGKAYTDALIVGDRLRQADKAKVDSLAESIDAIGLQQPISVWVEDDSHVHLVAGLHRFMAAKKLGWSEIPAIFVELDDIDRQLWEIDENLMRSELTATQEAEHLARRKELWAERGKSLPTFQKAKPGQKAFAAETAERIGKTKRAVNMATRRAEEVTAEARDVVRNTALDTGAYLDKLLKVPEAEQADKARDDLKVLHDRMETQRRKDEAAARKKEAKEAREAAWDRLLTRLLDELSQKSWDATIRDADDAGLTTLAKRMRRHMAPAANEAA